jgi:hypothetical protein
MANADIVMIDSSQDAWFDFDLSHYQRQLVNGTIRMTPRAGLRIFMPGRHGSRRLLRTLHGSGSGIGIKRPADLTP